MRRRFRVQQNASRLERSSGNDHDLGVNLAMLVRAPVNVMHSFGTSAAVDNEVADNRVAHQGEFAGARRRRQRNRWTVEVRGREASSLALVAIMAGGASAMRHGQVCDAVGNDTPTESTLDHVSGLQRAARQIHRRQKLSVRQLRQAFPRTAHPNVVFHQIVVGFEFLVADGPVFAVAVAGGGFEFVVAVAIAFARPAEGLAPDLASANPHERFVGGESVGMLQIVDEKLVAVFVAGVTQALHGLRLQQALLIAEAAELQLIRPDVLGEIASRNARRSSLKHDHGETAFSEFLGNPSAARTGTDDQGFVDLFPRD